ncbi:hypothetical protein BU23DRAFT_634022, partial [Bimuria novae-zelandiae CBS 107.79]
ILILAINLYYLYLLRSLTLRPRRVVLGRATNTAPKASLVATASTTRFWRLLLYVGGCEAFLLPF